MPLNTLQSEKETLLHHLHHNQNLLVLPNVWDPLGAKLLESLGYKAIATASASVAYSNGYQDGEIMSFDDVILVLKKIVRSVNVPVTADIESGYAKNNPVLKENIKKLMDTGIAGINFEDSHHDEQDLLPVEVQAKKIYLIKNTASQTGRSLFLNARTDVYIEPGKLSKEEQLTEAISRGKAYKQAGADGFYPIFLKDKASAKSIIEEVGLPVNLLLVAGIPDFSELQQIGVARLSLGPGFLKTAIRSMRNVAEKLLRYEGLEEIANNEITSDYLKNLISKKENYEQDKHP